MTLLLDAGALIAVERGHRGVLVPIEVERRRGRVVATHGGIVGQVWRNGSRQARLASLLRGVEVVALDAGLGRDAGRLLGAAGTSDVVDAALVALANDGDDIVTSDPDDLSRLIAASGMDIGLFVV